MEEKIRISNSTLNQMNKTYKGFENCYNSKEDGKEFVESIANILNPKSIDNLLKLNAKVMDYREFIQFMLDNGLYDWIVERVHVPVEKEDIMDWIDDNFYECIEHFYDDIKDSSFDWFVSEATEQYSELEDFYFFVVFYKGMNESKKFNLKEAIKRNIAKRLIKEYNKEPDDLYKAFKSDRNLENYSDTFSYGSLKHFIRDYSGTNEDSLPEITMDVLDQWLYDGFIEKDKNYSSGRYYRFIK